MEVHQEAVPCPPEGEAGVLTAQKKFHLPDKRAQAVPLTPEGRLRGHSGLSLASRLNPVALQPRHATRPPLPPGSGPATSPTCLSSSSQKQGAPFISGQSPLGARMECHLSSWG